MFYRNVWTAAELTNNCRPHLLNQKQPFVGFGRNQFQNSLHNARRNTRRVKFEQDPLESFPYDSTPLYPRKLIRPLIFTIGVSTASLVGSVIWEYENLRSHAYTLFKKPGTWLGAQQKKVYAQFKKEPGPLRKWWNSLNNNEKVFYPILTANVLVFGAWRVKAWQPFMIKYFCSNPQSSAVCLPMLLSTFSHHSPLHLAANMYVLYSFMPAAIASLGKEQFTALYLSSAVVSSFASFCYKVCMKQPGLSLGASGAIMAVLSYVCVQYPETKLSIIFLPMYTFAAGHAIKAIMAVDFAGILFGWKFLDHAAHLGGALFGIFWCTWGSYHLWGNRDKVQQYYHNLKKTDTGR